MDVKFCGQCGTPLVEGGLFCQECGWKVLNKEQLEQLANMDNQQHSSVVASQSYYQNAQQPPISMQNPISYGQNQFAQYSSQGGIVNNQKSKRFGAGLGIVALIVVVAVIAFLGIKVLKDRGFSIGSLTKNVSSESGETVNNEEPGAASKPNAKSDITFEQLAGEWTGKMKIEGLKNMEIPDDATEEEKAMFQQMLENELDCKLVFEENNMELSFSLPNGQNNDMDELEVNLMGGVITASEEGDDGGFSFKGTVLENEDGLQIDGIFEVSVLDNPQKPPIEFTMKFNVTKQ